MDHWTYADAKFFTETVRGIKMEAESELETLRIENEKLRTEYKLLADLTEGRLKKLEAQVGLCRSYENVKTAHMVFGAVVGNRRLQRIAFDGDNHDLCLASVCGAHSVLHWMLGDDGAFHQNLNRLKVLVMAHCRKQANGQRRAH